jgi:hypothetical protein
MVCQPTPETTNRFRRENDWTVRFASAGVFDFASSDEVAVPYPIPG